MPHGLDHRYLSVSYGPDGRRLVTGLAMSTTTATRALDTVAAPLNASTAFGLTIMAGPMPTLPTGFYGQ